MGNCAVEGGVFPGGEDFGEGYQHELAQVEAGMGEGELWCVHHFVVIEKQVDVYGAGGVAGCARFAYTSQLPLDFQTLVQKVNGGEMGFEYHYLIQEIFFAGKAPWGGFV